MCFSEIERVEDSIGFLCELMGEEPEPYRLQVGREELAPLLHTEEDWVLEVVFGGLLSLLLREHGEDWEWVRPHPPGEVQITVSGTQLRLQLSRPD